jgi:hypothetical protein
MTQNENSSKNIAVSEKDFINNIRLLVIKNQYPMEWMTMITLHGDYEGDYVPAIRDYVTGEVLFINDNKQYTRATAMKKLGKMWEKAENEL